MTCSISATIVLGTSSGGDEPFEAIDDDGFRADRDDDVACVGRYAVDRQAEAGAGRDQRLAAVAAFDGAVEQVRGAEEGRDELRGRPLVDFVAVPTCSRRPSRMTTMWSAMVRASSWSG